MTSTILITGANGEIGHGLVNRLAEMSQARIVALDLHAPDSHIQARCHRVVTGDIADIALLDTLVATYDFDVIYHLAALLSTKSERQPRLANRVNVDGTLNLLEMTVLQARQQEREIKFLYPSSIAVYGLPDTQTKHQAGKVREDNWCEPRTMYGINKLYCERLGLEAALQPGAGVRRVPDPGHHPEAPAGPGGVKLHSRFSPGNGICTRGPSLPSGPALSSR